MKKPLAIILIVLLLLSLSGCKSKDAVQFYYPRKEILYGPGGVITSDARDISHPADDLAYLLTLYLEGPIDQDLYSPFPDGTAVNRLKLQEGCLTISLSEHFSDLEGLDYTIACTCIALTCFSLTEVESVEITSENQTLPLNRDSVALADTAATDPG